MERDERDRDRHEEDGALGDAGEGFGSFAEDDPEVHESFRNRNQGLPDGDEFSSSGRGLTRRQRTVLPRRRDSGAAGHPHGGPAAPTFAAQLAATRPTPPRR